MVALDQAQQQLQQLFAAALRQSAHHAEVDERDAVVAQVKHVTRVRIGMKKTVLHNHFQHRMGSAFSQQAPVIPGLRCEPVQLVAGNAAHKILHVHALAGMSPVHARNHDMRQRRHVGGLSLIHI